MILDFLGKFQPSGLRTNRRNLDRDLRTSDCNLMHAGTEEECAAVSEWDVLKFLVTDRGSSNGHGSHTSRTFHSHCGLCEWAVRKMDLHNHYGSMVRHRALG